MEKRFLDGFKKALKDIDRNTVLPNISTGNTKLKADGIAAWGLVAGITCPGAGSCNKSKDGTGKVLCYAQNNLYAMDNVMRVRAENFISSQRDDFPRLMIDAVKALPRRFESIRIHDSGDYYSQEYIEKIAMVAAAVPGKRFYSYTKSLEYDLAPLWNLKNFTLIQSEGGKFDHLISYTRPHARIFRTLAELLAAGYSDCSESDRLAALGMQKIGLVVHGAGSKQF